MTHRPQRMVSAAALIAMLTGCESYEPRPLEQGPALAAAPAELIGGGAARHRESPDAAVAAPTRKVELGKPLDSVDVATLAVLNNPDLKAARAQRGVAAAQAFSAGLLPNPQISTSLAFVTQFGTATGWALALAQDVKALITAPGARTEAQLHAHAVDYELLWQEWQVIAKARLLVAQSAGHAALGRTLQATGALFADRYQIDRRALDRGDTTLTATTPDLLAWADLTRQIQDNERLNAAGRRDLDALLGLAPDVELPLAADLALPEPDAPAARLAIRELPGRRPDLIALQVGYQSQEQKVRDAVLGQFPAITLGASGGSDTTSVRSYGPTLALDLPIFNRNQGAIAIERATREQLRAEYSARLTTAAGEVASLLLEIEQLRGQRMLVAAQAGEAARMRAEAEPAFLSGNLDARSFVDLAAAQLQKDVEAITLEQAIRERQIALATLIGTDLPAPELSHAVASDAP